MARFRYAGFDESGAPVDGALEADSLEQARGDLTGRGVLLAELAPVAEGRDWRAVLGLGGERVRL